MRLRRGRIHEWGGDAGSAGGGGAVGRCPAAQAAGNNRQSPLAGAGDAGRTGLAGSGAVGRCPAAEAAGNSDKAPCGGWDGERWGCRGAPRWGVARRLKPRATATKPPAGAGTPTARLVGAGWTGCRGGGAGRPDRPRMSECGCAAARTSAWGAAAGSAVGAARRVGIAGRSRLPQTGAAGARMLIGRDLGAALVAWRSALLQPRRPPAESWGGLAGRSRFAQTSLRRPGWSRGDLAAAGRPRGAAPTWPRRFGWPGRDLGAASPGGAGSHRRARPDPGCLSGGIWGRRVGIAGRSRGPQTGAAGARMLIGRDLGAALVAWRSALLQPRRPAWPSSWGGLAGRSRFGQTSRPPGG